MVVLENSICLVNLPSAQLTASFLVRILRITQLVTKVPPVTDHCLAELGSPWLTLVVGQENSRHHPRRRVSCAVCPPTRPARSSQARQPWPSRPAWPSPRRAPRQRPPCAYQAAAPGGSRLGGAGQPAPVRDVPGPPGRGRFHGDVDYTNWTYAEPGSGVWAPEAASHALVFTYQGSQYAHTLNGGLNLTALSPERLAFSGSGSYNGGGITWKINGQVANGKVRATIAYDGSSPTRWS